MTTLPLSKLRTDGGTQPRSVLDFAVIEEYVEAMEAGVKFPPVDVFFDGSEYWLADGFHRVRAVAGAELGVEVDEIACNVEDARWFSYAANKANGLYRSYEDKHRAIKAALNHPAAAGKSDRQIADHIGVSDKTVAAWREKLFPSSEIPKIATRTVTRKGTTYQQDVSKIGKGRAATVKPDPAWTTTDDQRAVAVLNRDAVLTKAPTGVDEAIMMISLYMMTSPLDTREELFRRLRACLDLSIASMDRDASGGSR